MPINIFISYAPKDEELCQELVDHLNPLQRQGLVSVWCNRLIIAGKDRQKEINKQLEEASIILLLISVDFLKSNYLNSVEMRYSMERRAVDKARVIPIRLRPSDWDNAPFASLEAIPPNYEQTIGQYEKGAARDSEWLKVVSGIRLVINDLSSFSSNSADSPNKHPQSSAPFFLSNSTDGSGGQTSVYAPPPVVEPTASADNISAITPPQTPPKHRWFLILALLAVIVGVIIATVLHSFGGGATTLQFKEIVTEGNPVPVSIVQGDDKNIWFTNDEGEIRKITSDNSITKIRLSSGIGGGATGLTGITNGPDKNIWFTMTGKPVIGRFNVNADSFSYFSLPSAQDIRGTAITTGPDDNLWYVLGGISMAKIGCMTRMGAPCGEYDLGSGVNPSSIISAGGKLWFAEIDGIGWMIPGLDTKPHIIHGITALNMAFDSSNKQIWFTEPGLESLGHISLDGSILAEIPLTNLTPESIAIGSDGTIWFTAWSDGAKHPGGKIEHFSSDGKRMIASYDFRTASLPIHGIYEYNNGNGITVASNGQIWFIEYQGTAGPAKIGYSQQ